MPIARTSLEDPVRAELFGTGRLEQHATTLAAAQHATSGRGRRLLPRVEDNGRVLREIRDDLPPGFYGERPKLSAGPFVGYPRVYGIAWAYVAHTDARSIPNRSGASCERTSGCSR